MPKKEKTPWPTKDVMGQIYHKHLWGGKAHDFYSGAGSHDSEIINPYLECVISFFKSHNNRLTVCDLGCGDFNIGKHLTRYTKTYTAIDIVEHLIDRNKALFKEDNLEFQCLDISSDKLPIADCIILRQVLQHLSNAEIENIVKKLINYTYIVLTEHLPIGMFIPNRDIVSGQGIRLKQGSGVDLLEAPFNLSITAEQKIDDVVLPNNKGRIVTRIYKCQ
jgi:hypothetical protein